MKYKRYIYCIAILALAIYIRAEFSYSKPEHSSSVQIPISFFPLSNKPTMKVEINGKKYSLLVDLGAFYPIYLQEKHLNRCIDKELNGTFSFVDINGNSYTSEGFRVNNVKIQNIPISEVVILPEDTNFLTYGSKIWSSGIWDRLRDYLNLAVIDGRIGCSIFRETVCFFDFPNSSIIMAKNLESLREVCELNGFVQVPISIERAGIVVNLATDLGDKKFLMDTGATLSLLKRSQIKNEDITEFKPGKSFYTNHKTEIGGCDFGSFNFWLFDFSDSFNVDGILGIDFFKKNTICFDFQNEIAFIKPSHNMN